MTYSRIFMARSQPTLMFSFWFFLLSRVIEAMSPLHQSHILVASLQHARKPLTHVCMNMVGRWSLGRQLEQ